MSFGWMSTRGDAECFLHMVETCFLEKDIRTSTTNVEVEVLNEDRIRNSSGCEEGNSTNVLDSGKYRLSNIILYPVKSCGGLEVRIYCSCLLCSLKFMITILNFKIMMPRWQSHPLHLNCSDSVVRIT